MVRTRIIALVVLLILLVSFGCSARNGNAEKLSQSLSGDYSCRLNIQSETGELLFGGTLSKQGDEYAYILDYPEQAQAAKYKFKDGDTFMEIGDISIAVDSRNCKICTAFNILKDASEAKVGVSCEKVKLYGTDCTKISLNGGELYFANNKPLLLLWEGARAEITGFIYGKDDNFGN